MCGKPAFYTIMTRYFGKICLKKGKNNHAESCRLPAWLMNG